MIAIRKLSCPTFSGQNPGITAKLRNVSTTRRVRQASCSCRWWGHSEIALDALILRERERQFVRRRFVPIKTDDQLDLQSLHRVRERWVMRRTAVINQIRGLLLERGITLRKGRCHVDEACPGYWKMPAPSYQAHCRCSWRN